MVIGFVLLPDPLPEPLTILVGAVIDVPGLDRVVIDVVGLTSPSFRNSTPPCRFQLLSAIYPVCISPSDSADAADVIPT